MMEKLQSLIQKHKNERLEVGDYILKVKSKGKIHRFKIVKT